MKKNEGRPEKRLGGQVVMRSIDKTEEEDAERQEFNKIRKGKQINPRGLSPEQAVCLSEKNPRLMERILKN